MHVLLRSISPTSIVVVLLLAVLTSTAGSAAAASDDLPRWRWPLSGAPAVLEPFRAPAHEYGAGHRGIDLTSAVGDEVFAPAEGTIAFRGTVVDRPLLTIEHADGLVTTFEPVSSTLTAGDLVSAGQQIGVVDVGGHAPAGAMHLGVRRDGVYINPMLLFGAVPRAILLPCCT